jgi:NADH-quinone oxidoreductase subunit N
VQAGGTVGLLAVIAMLNAAAAAFYYLRVVVVMYMQESPEDAQVTPHGALMRAGLLLAGIGTVVVGLVPGLVIPMAEAAATAIH